MIETNCYMPEEIYNDWLLERGYDVVDWNENFFLFEYDWVTLWELNPTNECIYVGSWIEVEESMFNLFSEKDKGVSYFIEPHTNFTYGSGGNVSTNAFGFGSGSDVDGHYGILMGFFD